jgi:hypothetical protein
MSSNFTITLIFIQELLNSVTVYFRPTNLTELGRGLKGVQDDPRNKLMTFFGRSRGLLLYPNAEVIVLICLVFTFT